MKLVRRVPSRYAPSMATMRAKRPSDAMPVQTKCMRQYLASQAEQKKNETIALGALSVCVCGDGVHFVCVCAADSMCKFPQHARTHLDTGALTRMQITTRCSAREFLRRSRFFFPLMVCVPLEAQHRWTRNTHAHECRALITQFNSLVFFFFVQLLLLHCQFVALCKCLARAI